jgi:glycosyltransferase involved in cell wall biosynthesis
MQVGMVTHSYYLRDPRVRREAEALAAAGYAVDVVCLRRPGEARRERVNGVDIHRLPLTHKRAGKVRYVAEYAASLVLSALWMAALGLRRRFALVQVHTPPDLLVFSALVPRLLGAKVLLDLHDPMPETMLTIFGAGPDHWLVRVVRLQEQASAWFADHVITVTEQVRQALVERGLSPSKIDVVMNFADTRLFDARLREAPPAPDTDRFVVVFMGTLAFRYGVDVAIDAIAQVRRRVPHVRLKVIGDGEERPALEARVAERGLQDHVEFAGQVPIDRIPATAWPAHVGIAPHRRDRLYDMCFPSKIYDYLALGLPVVAAWTESLAYYYGADTVEFFDSGDAAGLADRIVALRDDAGRVAALRRNGAAFLEAHNWAVERDRYLAIVHRLTGARVPDRAEASRVRGAG